MTPVHHLQTRTSLAPWALVLWAWAPAMAFLWTSSLCPRRLGPLPSWRLQSCVRFLCHVHPLLSCCQNAPQAGILQSRVQSEPAFSERHLAVVFRQTGLGIDTSLEMSRWPPQARPGDILARPRQSGQKPSSR